MYCRSCQSALAPEDAFCPKCGTARAAVASTLTETQMIAPVTEVVAPVVRERVVAAPRAPLMPEEPRSSGWLIALAVLAALLLAVVLFVALRPHNATSPATTTTTAVAPLVPPPTAPLPTTSVTVAPMTTAAPTTTTAAPTTTTTASTTTSTTIP